MRSMTIHRQREAGIVSIMVTLITMVVISLIILGFADITRNEQRDSLDAQLSTQAYYAAESGVNDARAVMESLIANGTPVTNKTVCGNQGSYNLNNVVDPAHGASYPCVLVNATPAALSYNVGYTSTVIPLVSGGAAFGRLTFTWKPANGTPGNLGNCYPAGGNNVGDFVAATGGGQWNCDWPVLRIDLLDANGPTFARANWNNVTFTYFLIPYNSNANSVVGLGAHGTAVRAQCIGASTTCTVNFNGVGGKKYYARITTLYRTNSLLTITAAGGATFTNAEALIDSTGKAQDVLRRILVAVDLTGANAQRIPSNAVTVEDSICKRFGITKTSFDVYQTLGAGGEGNSLCTQASVGRPTP